MAEPRKIDRAERAARAAAARQEAERREKRHRRLVIGLTAGAVAVVVAVVATVIYVDTADERALAAAAEKPIEGVKEYGGKYGKDLGRDHVTTDVTYDPLPPVGGNHDQYWQNCGVYTDQAQVKDRNAVHSLEHGAVWVTYDPSLPAAEVAKLREAVSVSDYTLLSPYAGIPSPVVASAWGEQLQLPNADDPRLAVFIRKYVNGPQTKEPGGACSGAVGTPA
ncbi:Protein of unknown function [Quadrisphaera granulorum]|uniref:Uncharacterized protein DUF3105 n=1 Tax=Quadrisphaera granulorum TaxID=317664 RepID=A0A315ZKD2_9ACTN|nr:DUF3105 domain-containing protein [Quadrisphaera granulorum]PWJ45154.1 uncharacterized protein DUF3105 [Quadrisphaera granulorum]SZE99197.1 Protein of unknown function [Quadrisphaera granulorum]